jgi:uncharacterized CHY-type Zn-finger protein
MRSLRSRPALADGEVTKMKCCGIYYACKHCHDALAGHPIEAWPDTDGDQKAIFCGACRTELTISAYLECNSRCPACQAAFNPGCRNHHHFYFAGHAV